MAESKEQQKNETNAGNVTEDTTGKTVFESVFTLDSGLINIDWDNGSKDEVPRKSNTEILEMIMHCKIGDALDRYILNKYSFSEMCDRRESVKKDNAVDLMVRYVEEKQNVNEDVDYDEMFDRYFCSGTDFLLNEGNMYIAVYCNGCHIFLVKEWEKTYVKLDTKDGINEQNAHNYIDYINNTANRGWSEREIEYPLRNTRTFGIYWGTAYEIGDLKPDELVKRYNITSDTFSKLSGKDGDNIETGSTI